MPRPPTSSCSQSKQRNRNVFCDLPGRPQHVNTYCTRPTQTSFSLIGTPKTYYHLYTSPRPVSKSVPMYSVSLCGVDVLLDTNEKDKLVDLVVQDARKEALKEQNVERYRQIVDRAVSDDTSESPQLAHICVRSGKEDRRLYRHSHGINAISSSSKANSVGKCYSESHSDIFARRCPSQYPSHIHRSSCDDEETSEVDSMAAAFHTVQKDQRNNNNNNNNDNYSLLKMGSEDIITGDLCHNSRTSPSSMIGSERSDSNIIYAAPCTIELTTPRGSQFSKLFIETENHKAFMERRIKENQIDIEYSHRSLSTSISKCMHEIIAIKEMALKGGMKEDYSDTDTLISHSDALTSEVKSFTKVFTFAVIVTRLRRLLNDARIKIKARHLREREDYLVSIHRERALYKHWKRWQMMLHACKHFKHVTLKKTFYSLVDIAFEKRWKMHSIVSKLNKVIFENYRLRRIFQTWRIFILIRSFVDREWLLPCRKEMWKSKTLNKRSVIASSADVTQALSAVDSSSRELTVRYIGNSDTYIHDSPNEEVDDLDICSTVNDYVLYALPLSNLNIVKQSIIDFLRHRLSRPISSSVDNYTIISRSVTRKGGVLSAALDSHIGSYVTSDGSDCSRCYSGGGYMPIMSPISSLAPPRQVQREYVEKEFISNSCYQIFSNYFMTGILDHVLDVVMLPYEVVRWLKEHCHTGTVGEEHCNCPAMETMTISITNITYTVVVSRLSDQKAHLFPLLPERLTKQYISDYSLIRPDCSINVVDGLAAQQCHQYRNMYLSYVTPAWMTWRKFLRCRKKRNNNKEQLRKFLKSTRRPRVLASCMDLWKYRHKISISITFYCTTLKLLTFVKWRKKTEKALLTSDMMTKSETFLLYSRKRTVIKRWKDSMRAAVLFESIGTVQALIHRKTMLEAVYKMQSLSPRYLITQLVKCPLNRETLMQIDTIMAMGNDFPYRNTEEEGNIFANRQYSSILTEMQNKEFNEVKELATISWLQIACFNSWKKYMIRSKRYRRFRDMHLEQFGFNLCRRAFTVWKMKGNIPWTSANNQSFVNIQQHQSHMYVPVDEDTTVEDGLISSHASSSKLLSNRIGNLKYGDTPLGSTVTFALPSEHTEIPPLALGCSSIDTAGHIRGNHINILDSLYTPFSWIDAKYAISTFVSALMSFSGDDNYCGTVSDDNLLSSSHSLREGSFNVFTNVHKLRLDVHPDACSVSSSMHVDAPVYIPKVTDVGLLASAIATNAAAVVDDGGAALRRSKSWSSFSSTYTNFGHASRPIVKKKSQLSSTFDHLPSEYIVRAGSLRNINTPVSDVSENRESNASFPSSPSKEQSKKSKIRSISFKLFNEEVFNLPSPGVYMLLNECRSGNRRIRTVPMKEETTTMVMTPQRVYDSPNHESLFSRKVKSMRVLYLDSPNVHEILNDGLFTRYVFRQICYGIVALGMVTSALRRRRLSFQGSPSTSPNRHLSMIAHDDGKTNLNICPYVGCQSLLEDVVNKQENIEEKIYKGELSRLHCNRGICNHNNGEISISSPEESTYPNNGIECVHCIGSPKHHSIIGMSVGAVSSNTEKELVNSMLSHLKYKDVVGKARRNTMLRLPNPTDLLSNGPIEGTKYAPMILVQLLKVVKKRILDAARREDLSWKKAMILSELIQLRAFRRNDGAYNIDEGEEDEDFESNSRNANIIEGHCSSKGVLSRHKLLDEHTKEGRYRTVVTFTESNLITYCDGGMTVPSSLVSSSDVQDSANGGQRRGNHAGRHLDHILEYLDRTCRRDYPVLYQAKLKEVSESSTRRGCWLRKVGASLPIDNINSALLYSASNETHGGELRGHIWPKRSLDRGSPYSISQRIMTDCDDEESYKNSRIVEEETRKKQAVYSLFILATFLKEMVRDATCITIESRMRNRFLLSRYNFCAAAVSFIESIKSDAPTGVVYGTTGCKHNAKDNKRCAWACGTPNSIRERDDVHFGHYFTQNERSLHSHKLKRQEGDHIILVPSLPKDIRPRPLLRLKKPLQKVLSEDVTANAKLYNYDRRMYYHMMHVMRQKAEQTTTERKGPNAHLYTILGGSVPLVKHVCVSSQHTALRAAIKLRQSLEYRRASRAISSANNIIYPIECCVSSTGATESSEILLSDACLSPQTKDKSHSVRGVGIIDVGGPSDAIHYMKFLL